MAHQPLWKYKPEDLMSVAGSGYWKEYGKYQPVLHGPLFKLSGTESSVVNKKAPFKLKGQEK